MMKKIELIPAIDIIEDKCVRLTKGEYSSQKTYSENPLEIAKQLEDIGVKRLHMVDLDGAKSKHIVNHKVLETIANSTSLKIDFGGGIKSDADIHTAFDSGASLVTIGSVASTSPELFMSWIDKYGTDKIILGADVRNGMISINGWKEDSQYSLFDFLDKYIEAGIINILCTEISRDGMLEGPATDLYKEIMQRYPNINLIASGGISCMKDIEVLDDNGIPSVVFGKAMYEERISMADIRNWLTEN
ncbi:MAG: 1-(5-phosphoribosyl)-5-[(5-phosphoribosylamino)methylideneamino]imidazole-4-carboxamide isomerase [Bacteroides sp. 43_108]|nr:MAG: 1-(5-phosphoribosyl)-5-[(5-phosphoribosylamino)methylideneamino]imidazole-4-carboxamide isomerase [Bacteroides sp. 43_108]